jgi:hypothetical protein
MYQDTYLSFSDEAAAKAVLYRIEGAVEANEELGIQASPGHEVANYANIDTIGVIYKPTGETTEQDGMAVPVMAPIPGWHVNVRLAEGEDIESLQAFKATLKTPIRVWA